MNDESKVIPEKGTPLTAKPKAASLAVEGTSQTIAKEASKPKSQKIEATSYPELIPIVFPLTKGTLRLLVPCSDDEQSITINVDGQEHIYALGESLRDPSLSFELLTSAKSPAGATPLTIIGNPTGKIGFNLAPIWTLEGSVTYYITQPDNVPQLEVEAVWVDPIFGRSIPIAPNAPLKFSVHYGLHRCTGSVRLKFLSAAGKPVGAISMDLLPGKFGGEKLENYAHLSSELISPDGSSSVEVSFVRSKTRGNDDNSYLFFAKPSLAYSGDEPASGGTPTLVDSIKRAATILRASGALEAIVPVPRLSSMGASKISIHWGIDQVEVLGSPLTVPQHAPIRGEITGIDGLTLQGTVDPQIRDYADPSLHIYIDGTFRGSVKPRVNSAGATVFGMSFPAALFDGTVHLASIQSSHGETLAEAALVFPFCTTPWNLLHKYGDSPLPAPLAPLAAQRAESLRGQLRLLTRGNADFGGDLSIRIGQLYAAHELVLEGPQRAGRRRSSSLEFPRIEKPRVSVVVPAHEKWEVTRHCLASLLLAPNQASFEVILVDDRAASSIAEQLKNVVVVRQKVATGFTRACIAGASKARGEYLTFLKPTTEVTTYWLDELLAPFENFDNVGITGSKLISPIGRLQHAGGMVWKTGVATSYGQSENAHHPHYNYARQVDFVSRNALLLPATIWEKLDGFSIDFEDDGAEIDLAFKARAAGLKTVFAPQSIVVNHETIAGREAIRLQEALRSKLKKKWAPALEQHGAESTSTAQEYSRIAHRKALVIDFAVPRPNNDAGSYAAVQEMRLLTALGFKVTLAPENFAHTGKDTERLQRMGVEVLHAPFTLSMNEVLEKRGAEFDLVYITRYYTAEKYIDLVRKHAPQAKLAFCNADLHFLREMREAFLENTPEAFATTENTRRDELAVCEKADLVLSYSDVELAVLESHAVPANKTALCPWVVETPDNIPAFEERNGIAFVGGFGHAPNGLAMRAFVEDILPLIRVKNPEIILHIYGSDSEERLADLEQPGVVIEGHIDDVSEAYDRCRVFIAPLLTGAGLKGKVISAFARGVPTVLSKVAAEATGATHRRECMIAETPRAWADAVVGLYTDAGRWKSLSLASQELARSRYSMAHGKEVMRNALEKIDLFEEALALVARTEILER